MTRRRNGRGSRRGNNQQIVTVAQDGDVVGARFDKMVASMRSNEAATPILVKGVFGLSTATTAAGTIYSIGNLTAEDDFVSLAQQFTTFKVKAMRFEVFHTNPVQGAQIAMSTVHLDGGSVTNLVTQASVVDGEDSKYLDAGAGKQVFYWNARGTLENAFQSTTAYTDFGGLRYYIEATTGTVPVGRVIVTAQVIFRGRT